MTDAHGGESSSQISKNRTSHFLIILLLSINILFIGFIFFSEGGKPSTEEMIAEVVHTKNEVMQAYEVELPLTRYVLLKIEIQKNINEQKNNTIIYPKISQAIHELESILNRDGIENILEPNKRESIIKELIDMKALSRKYASEHKSSNSKGVDSEG
ncbi:hypothetical protein ACFL6F_02250 [Planctomycetota bacterium]